MFQTRLFWNHCHRLYRYIHRYDGRLRSRQFLSFYIEICLVTCNEAIFSFFFFLQVKSREVCAIWDKYQQDRGKTKSVILIPKNYTLFCITVSSVNWLEDRALHPISWCSPVQQRCSDTFPKDITLACQLRAAQVCAPSEWAQSEQLDTREVLNHKEMLPQLPAAVQCFLHCGVQNNSLQFLHWLGAG